MSESKSEPPAVTLADHDCSMDPLYCPRPELHRSVVVPQQEGGICPTCKARYGGTTAKTCNHSEPAQPEAGTVESAVVLARDIGTVPLPTAIKWIEARDAAVRQQAVKDRDQEWLAALKRGYGTLLEWAGKIESGRL